MSADRHCIASANTKEFSQKQRPCPKTPPWADSLKQDFGYDSLLEQEGNKMKACTTTRVRHPASQTLAENALHPFPLDTKNEAKDP